MTSSDSYVNKPSMNPIPIFVTDKLGNPFDGDITVAIYKNGNVSTPDGTIEKAQKGLYFYYFGGADLAYSGTFIILVLGEEAFGHATIKITSPDEEMQQANNIWNFPMRSLTQPGVTQTLPKEDDPLIFYRDSTNTFTLNTGIPDLDNSGRYEIWFTMKEVLDAPDSQALLQLNSGAGIVYLDKKDNRINPIPGSPDGFIRAGSNGDVMIIIDAEAASRLSLYSVTPVTWDLKVIDHEANVVTPALIGLAYVKPTPTRATQALDLGGVLR